MNYSIHYTVIDSNRFDCLSCSQMFFAMTLEQTIASLAEYRDDSFYVIDFIYTIDSNYNPINTVPFTQVQF